MDFFKIFLLFLLFTSSLQTLSSDSIKPSSKECEGSVLSSIDSLNLSARQSNCLKAEGIYTIELLIQQTETDLLRIPNFGKKSLAEVKARLAERDLQLSEVSKRFDIDRLNLSTAVRNTLVSAGIDSVEKLPATIEELPKTPNRKEWDLAEIKARLEEEDILPDIDRLGLFAHAKDPLVERGIVSILSSIDSLQLTLRQSNCLKAEGIYTIELLIQQTETDLLRIPNFGKKSLAEVKARLAERGLQLSEVSKRFDIDRLNLSTAGRNTLVSAGIDSVEKLPATIEELSKTLNLKERDLAEIKARLEEEDILPDIDRLGLSAQAKDPLVERGIVSIKKLTAHREQDLRIRVPNLREEGIQEIKRRLAAKGLALRGSHLHGTNVVYHVLGEVFPRLGWVHLYEGEDVVDWPSDWKQVLKETLPGIELSPFVPRSELAKLTAREEQVLTLRLGLKGERRHTVKEIGQIFNISERIRQIHNKALRKLKTLHALSRALWLKSILPSNPDWTSHPEQVETVIRQFSSEELDRIVCAESLNLPRKVMSRIKCQKLVE